jgi:hypothetical protein
LWRHPHGADEKITVWFKGKRHRVAQPGNQKGPSDHETKHQEILTCEKAAADATKERARVTFILARLDDCVAYRLNGNDVQRQKERQGARYVFPTIDLAIRHLQQATPDRHTGAGFEKTGFMMGYGADMHHLPGIP